MRYVLCERKGCVGGEGVDFVIRKVERRVEMCSEGDMYYPQPL